MSEWSDGQIAHLETKLEEAYTLIKKLVAEVEKHEREYHHVTDRELLAKAKELS